ncbi:MAG: purine-nucleoside phosphorylase [Coriobacteriia bacterium]|nr:purine-nucleoside phosphorylase [Coriobacteriia bacterium]
MSIGDLSVAAEDVEAYLESGAPHPRVVVIAGSGLGGLADAVERQHVVSHMDLPGFPKAGTSVRGHEGRVVGGYIGDTPVAIFQGRVHCYQGVSARDAAYPARFAAALGAEVLVVTNAAGGVSEDLAPGQIVLIRDHINLMGDNPLLGWSGPEGGTPFVSMYGAYDKQMRSIAVAVAEEIGVTVTEGVYAGLLGPTYETPAEVAFVRTAGADVVGMSTVPEVIVARAFGLKVLGLSLVTNVAGASGISHAEVLEAGKHAEESLTALVGAVLSRL